MGEGAPKFIPRKEVTIPLADYNKGREERNDDSEDVLTSAGNLTAENTSFSGGNINDGLATPTDLERFNNDVTADINRNLEGLVDAQLAAERRRTTPPVPENLPVYTYTPDQTGRNINDKDVPQEESIIIDPEYQTAINQEEEKKAFDANIDGQINQALEEMKIRDSQTLAEKYQKEKIEAFHNAKRAEARAQTNLEELRNLIKSMPDDTPNTTWKEASVTKQETRELEELDLEHTIDKVNSVKISSNEQETQQKNDERFKKVDAKLKDRLQTFENQFGPLTQSQKSRLDIVKKSLDEAKKEGNALKYENLSSRFEKTLDAITEEVFMEQGNNINTLATNEHTQRAKDLKNSLTQTEIDRATKPKSIIKTIGSYFGSLFRK
jgi:hypothetical protein